jgi:hypothetical protein
VRADVGAAELPGGGRRRCARVGEERRGALEKMGTSRRCGGDDDEGREAIWGKQLSTDLEGNEAYIEPPTFCHRSYYQP